MIYIIKMIMMIQIDSIGIQIITKGLKVIQNFSKLIKMTESDSKQLN